MKKKISILIAFFLIGILQPRCQQIIENQRIIDSLELTKESNFLEKIHRVTQQKRLVDLQYYETLFSSFKLYPDKKDRIQTLKIISDIPWYKYREKNLSNKTRDLYVKSLRELIKECDGDLKELEAIRVYPAYHSEIYYYLKMAIVKAGGKWTRGEIPLRQVSGNLIPEEPSNQ